VVTNILLRRAENPGALDNIKLVQVFELSQIAADVLAHTARRPEDETMAAPRPRLQVMWLTDGAAERIKAVMAKAERPIAAVRVGVKNGGCAGMSYFMEYAEKSIRSTK
jgi:hypothetical protein